RTDSVLSLTHFPVFSFFFFMHTATPSIYTLSLHDALPISLPADAIHGRWRGDRPAGDVDAPSMLPRHVAARGGDGGPHDAEDEKDRKSTRLNSSHVAISYAVFCLKKKKL